MTRRPLAALLLALALVAAPAARAQESPGAAPAAPAGKQDGAGDRLYGFEITRQLVDRERILPGGPGRDGIRAIDAPAWAEASVADAVSPDTRVLGVAFGGEARAYLLPVLEAHQIVNDVVAGVPIAVTYDPLAGAGVVFDRRVDGRTLRFGVSGLVYNSGFLLYDRETESLWSQLQGRAISGDLAGKELARIRSREEDFATWLERQPRTKILIPPDPENVDYNEPRYAAYAERDDAPFPVEARDRRFHAKELVLGVVADGTARAYLASLVQKHGGQIEDEIAGKTVVVRYDAEDGVFAWEAPSDVDVVAAYWFAWKAFHPDTEIWRDPGTVPGREP